MAKHDALPLVVLTEQFAKLPGIGMKSAARLAYHIMKMSPPLHRLSSTPDRPSTIAAAVKI